jgi:hypothetical protein
MKFVVEKSQFTTGCFFYLNSEFEYITDDKIRLISAWCDEYLSGYWNECDRYFFIFDPDDQVLFKLTWM